MWSFGALCDEFLINTRMFLKLELNPTRESTLHFFEQVRKTYPSLTRLRRRDDGGLVLEEDSEDGRGRRTVRLEQTAIKFSMSNPPSAAAARQFGQAILNHAPYALSLSELDLDYMDVVFSFELEYRGNHDELIADTFFPDNPLIRALSTDQTHVIDCQPFFGVSLAPDCETQAYVEIKGRTSTFELRTGEYEPAPLSVQLTLRRYWGSGELPAAAAVHQALLASGQQVAEERIVPHVVQPLAAAIASRR